MGTPPYGDRVEIEAKRLKIELELGSDWSWLEAGLEEAKRKERKKVKSI